MKPIPQISDAEYKVMKTVWAHAPISTPQVTKLLAAQNDWSPKTVQTLLSRLVKKRALTYEKHGRAFFYTPLVKEETASFLNRFYDGCFSSLVSNFLQEDRLTAREIRELKEILDTELDKEDE